jgi:hypothetical protein
MFQDPDTQFLLLASHDTNILYLQRLLNLNWIPYGYTNRVASTGGSLSFELYRSNTDGELYVKVHSRVDGCCEFSCNYYYEMILIDILTSETLVLPSK